MRTLMASGDGGAGGDAVFSGGGGDTQYLRRRTVAVPLPRQQLHTFVRLEPGRTCKGWALGG